MDPRKKCIPVGTAEVELTRKLGALVVADAHPEKEKERLAAVLLPSDRQGGQ